MAPKHHNPQSKNIYHGYFPFLESDPSHKEFIDLGRPIEEISEWERKGCALYEKNPWPEGEYEEIQETFEKHYRVMHGVAMQLIRCLALGLGKKAEYFDPWFKDECSSTLRGIHYMPRSAESLALLNEDQKKLVTPEHTDTGFITLLSTFMYPGLQVLINGEYRDISPAANSIVVNIGDTLEQISNFQIKSTKHRVLDIG